MTHRHPRRLALSAAALTAGAALPAGCAGGQATKDADPTARTGNVGSVAPALEQYDAEQVQALWDDESLSARDRGLVTIAVHVASGSTDDLWLRPGLEPRDRSLVTVVALVTTGQADQIPYHLGRAMDSGLTAEEIDPLMEHLAYVTGWPKVFTAMPVVTETLESR